MCNCSTQQKLQGQMLFQADSDQVTACESPRMECFLSVHSSTSAAVIYRLAIHLSSAMGLLSLLWTACQDEFLCLEHHCPCAYIECLGFPDQHFATDVSWSLTNSDINKSDRNHKPLPANLAMYWEEMEHTSSYPWIFLARAPLACPRSSSISARLRAVPVTFLPPYPLSPQLRLHHQLHIKPHLAPHNSLCFTSPHSCP